MTDSKPLAGKTAVVTGASRGIGKAIAMEFARAGADLAILSRTEAELNKVAEEAQALGVKCHVVTADLADPASAQAAADQIGAKLGKVDVLMNNAGADLQYGIEVKDSDPTTWWRTIEVNIFGVYLITKFLLDHINDGGKIINMSSGMGKTPAAGQSCYVVSKAGLHIFTEVLANELWPRNIDVNNLIPGPVATDMFNWKGKDRHYTAEEVLEKFKDGLPPMFPPMERMKPVSEVADLALYLATRPPGGPTGQTYSIARRPM
jgi:3-oxoacyl-[acyl-carrier protein] reductase